MQKRWKISMLLWLVPLLFLGWGLFYSGRAASAASAEISIRSKATKYYVGDTVYIIITVSSSTPIRSFQGTFSYDSRVLRYMTGGNIASGNDNEFYISDTDREVASTTLKYSVKFYARKANGTTVALKKPYIVCGEDEKEMSVSFNSFNMMIEKGAEQTAAAKESKAPEAGKKPKSTVNSDASGEPRGTVVPSGTPVPQASPSPTKKAGKSGKADTAKQQNNQKVTGVISSVAGGKVSLYAGSRFIVEDVPEEAVIPDGFGKTQFELDGEVVDAYALESDTEHSYFLIYCKNQKTDKEAKFYLYDREEQTLMPYEKVQSWYRGIGEKSVVVEQRNTLDKEEQTLKYIIAVLVVFCILMLLAVISVYLHFKGDSGQKWQDSGKI